MQVAKVCIVGCFAVSRSARIGLIVLALAIAVVGAGAVGMAFLPAAVTEPVVKPVTQSVELLTGDDKPETITVDFDEQPAVLGISNYPRIQLGAMRYTTDTSLIDRASELLKGKTFKRWYGYASYRAKANDMVGGCHSSIELDTANGAKLCDVSYDPGYEGNEGPGIYIMDGDVAYVMEGIMSKLGLSGRAFIPMILGFGCTVPAVMATRTLPSERDRKMTIMTTTFIPCGAKLPIIALIAGAFFDNAGWVAWSAYFVGVAAIVCSGIILKKTKMFAGDPAPFVMELPAYHFPSMKGVLIHMWERARGFIIKAGTIIFAVCVIIWFFSAFNAGLEMVEDIEDSMMAAFGHAISWIFAPLGLGDWKGAVAVI